MNLSEKRMEEKKTQKKKYLYLRLQGLNNALAKDPLI